MTYVTFFTLAVSFCQMMHNYSHLTLVYTPLLRLQVLKLDQNKTHMTKGLDVYSNIMESHQWVGKTEITSGIFHTR